MIMHDCCMARKQARRVERGLAGRHERRGDHPQERDHRQERRQDEQRVDDDGLHERVLCTLNCSSVTAAMKRKRMNATAAAYPMFHHLKPCSYISITTESV